MYVPTPLKVTDPETVLTSESFGGNLHETTTAINARGLSDFVLTMHSVSGFSTIVVFRFPKNHPALENANG